MRQVRAENLARLLAHLLVFCSRSSVVWCRPQKLLASATRTRFDSQELLGAVVSFTSILRFVVGLLTEKKTLPRAPHNLATAPTATRASLALCLQRVCAAHFAIVNKTKLRSIGTGLGTAAVVQPQQTLGNLAFQRIALIRKDTTVIGASRIRGTLVSPSNARTTTTSPSDQPHSPVRNLHRQAQQACIRARVPVAVSRDTACSLFVLRLCTASTYSRSLAL